MHYLNTLVTFLIALAFFSVPTNSQSSARILLDALQSHYYNATTGLWNTAGWWNSANSLEVVVEYIMYTNDNTYLNIVANTFARTNIYEILSGSYDDELWWAIAWLRAYELTKIRNYFDRSIIIWNSVLQEAWDNTCGGGVWWSYKKTYKNAITNELFLFLSTELYKTDGNSTYLTWAIKEWQWFERSGMINSNYLVNDGLNNCKNNGQTEWTYNQGVILGGLAGLYQATQNSTLLTIAQNIADSVTKHLTYPNSILKESCEDANNCDGDQVQFKGIYVRYLGILTNLLPSLNPRKNVYTQWLNKNLNSILTQDKSPENLCGVKWVGPLQQVNAPTQTSALDCAVAVIHVANK